MSINLNTVKTVISKVNSKGASLLRKDTGLSIGKAAKEGLSVPEGAKTYDAVRVGRNFKPDESYRMFSLSVMNMVRLSTVTQEK